MINDSIADFLLEIGFSGDTVMARRIIERAKESERGTFTDVELQELIFVERELKNRDDRVKKTKAYLFDWVRWRWAGNNLVLGQGPNPLAGMMVDMVNLSNQYHITDDVGSEISRAVGKLKSECPLEHKALMKYLKMMERSKSRVAKEMRIPLHVARDLIDDGIMWVHGAIDKRVVPI